MKDLRGGCIEELITQKLTQIFSKLENYVIS